MHLHIRHAYQYGHSFLLQLCLPVKVGLFIKPCSQLEVNDHLLAVLGRIDKRIDDL